MRPRWPYTAIFVFSWPFFKSTAVLPRSRTSRGHLRFSVYFVTNTSIKCARDGKNFRIKFHSPAAVKVNGFNFRASLRDVHWDENSSQQDRFGPGYFFWQNQAAMQDRNYGNFMPTAPIVTTEPVWAPSHATSHATSYTNLEAGSSATTSPSRPSTLIPLRTPALAPKSDPKELEHMKSGQTENNLPLFSCGVTNTQGSNPGTQGRFGRR